MDLPFNDIDFYHHLLTEKGCISVEISKVKCLHSFEIMRGIQIVYRSIFSDNTSRETDAPLHLMNRGYYTYEHSLYKTSVFELTEGEFLTDIWTRQDEEIVHAIQLVTNYRRADFGGYGGKEHPKWIHIESWSNLCEWGLTAAVPNPDASHRVVAVSGAFLSGALHRIGHYSQKAIWEKMRPLVLIRSLAHNQRAHKRQCISTNRERDVIQNFLVHSNDDIFRKVSSFIIP